MIQIISTGSAGSSILQPEGGRVAITVPGPTICRRSSRIHVTVPRTMYGQIPCSEIALSDSSMICTPRLRD